MVTEDVETYISHGGVQSLPAQPTPPAAAREAIIIILIIILIQYYLSVDFSSSIPQLRSPP